MRFDPIGPYDLKRGDMLVAALAISFILGSRGMRIRSWLTLVAGLVVIVGTLATDDWTMSLLAGFVLFMIFIGAPLLQSPKRSKDVVLREDSAGILVENALVVTTYKWATLGATRQIASRLMVMITKNCALVIPARTTSPDNLARLTATITDSLAGSGR